MYIQKDISKIASQLLKNISFCAQSIAFYLKQNMFIGKMLSTKKKKKKKKKKKQKKDLSFKA